jgi:hypothetical protein
MQKENVKQWMSPPKPSCISCYNTPLVNPFSLYIFNSLQNLLVKWIHIDFSEPQFLQPLPCIAWCFFRSLSSEKPQWVSILDPVNDDKESFLTHLLGFEHNAGLEFLVVIGLKKKLDALGRASLGNRFFSMQQRISDYDVVNLLLLVCSGVIRQRSLQCG